MQQIVSSSLTCKHIDLFGSRSLSRAACRSSWGHFPPRCRSLLRRVSLDSERTGVCRAATPHTHTHTKLGKTIDAARTTWFQGQRGLAGGVLESGQGERSSLGKTAKYRTSELTALCMRSLNCIYSMDVLHFETGFTLF